MINCIKSGSVWWAEGILSTLRLGGGKEAVISSTFLYIHDVTIEHRFLVSYVQKREKGLCRNSNKEDRNRSLVDVEKRTCVKVMEQLLGMIKHPAGRDYRQGPGSE